MDYHPLNYLSFNTEGSNVSSNIKRITLVASLRRWPLSSVTGGRIRSVLTGLFHRHTHIKNIFGVNQKLGQSFGMKQSLKFSI